METDKRPFYNWIMVLLINIGAIILFIVLISDSETYWDIAWWYFGIFIFASVAPILISESYSQKKNYFGYGIPILLLLPITYFVYDYYTCTGKFCGIESLFYGFGFGSSAVIFAIFYTVGIYSKKWSPKFVLLLSLVLPVLIVGGLLAFYIISP